MKELNISNLKQKHDFKRIKQEPKNKLTFSSILNREINFDSTRINDKIKEKFYTEFYTLLSAGIDFRSALEIIESDYSSKKIKHTFQSLRKDVIGGNSLSGSMKQSKYFTPFEFNSIAIGEETGRLQEQLKELALFFSQKIKQKRQLISALTYPSIVLSVALGAIVFMLNYLVPMFEDIFKRFGGNLPRLTKIIIASSDWVGSYFGYILLLLILFILFIYSQRNKTYFRKVSSYALLKIPFLGKLILRINLAQFSNSMQLLLNSNVPLVKSLDLTQKMIVFYPIQVTIDNIKSDIVKGIPLHVSLQNCTIYPKKMISILKVAEETNTLGISFHRMTLQYQDEVQLQTSLINTALEPVIIVVLGIVIAVILIAMYLPLFQVNSLMNV